MWAKCLLLTLLIFQKIKIKASAVSDMDMQPNLSGDLIRVSVNILYFFNFTGL